jgi:hypothetical protein
MTEVLLDAGAAAQAAAERGWDHVPARPVARLQRRYRYALEVAFESLLLNDLLGEDGGVVWRR